MKKLIFGLATSAVIAATCFAGTETYSSGKASKEYKQVETPTCFSDKEIQLDVFGAYQVGEAGRSGPIHDHAWGGGVAANYFFARYFGLSVEGTWLDGKDGRGSTSSDIHSTTLHSVTGSAIFRYPIDRLCLAPYVFIGGGGTFDGAKWALGHVGVGLEYRIIPNKLGLFADGRWVYYGDRFGSDVQNNFLFRTGVRMVF